MGNNSTGDVSWGEYRRVILDGTGLFCFKERHCKNCLCTTRKDEEGKEIKLYYHKVLEAKIVLSDNVIISLGTEFIENENEEVSKQDCELNAGKTQTMNVLEYECIDKEEKKQRMRFQWVTSLELTKRNPGEMILAGRGHWKIENKGFNNQKNGLYRIEHLNSRNSNAMKNHYLLTQISDILMQIYLSWNPYIRDLKQTIKNTSSRLLKSFCGQTVTEEDVSYILRNTTMYLE